MGCDHHSSCRAPRGGVAVAAGCAGTCLTMPGKFEPRRTPVANSMSDLSVSAAIDTRRSIREFTNEIVPQSVIREMLEIARRAPSGGNVQVSFTRTDDVLWPAMLTRTGGNT